MKIVSRSPLDNEKEFVRNIHHRGYRDVVVAQFGSWDEQRQDQFFEQKWANANMSVLEVDGTACGFATVEEHPAEVRLVEIVIDPDSQGRGIGTAFVQQLIDRAKDLDLAVRLQVLIENRAIELYRRMGFKEYDATETHLLMQRCESTFEA